MDAAPTAHTQEKLTEPLRLELVMHLTRAKALWWLLDALETDEVRLEPAQGGERNPWRAPRDAEEAEEMARWLKVTAIDALAEVLHEAEEALREGSAR